jgi:hypothetical protein
MGWNPEKSTILDPYLEMELATRLKVDGAVIRAVWFGEVDPLPEEILKALEEHGMNRSRIIQCYSDWREETVLRTGKKRFRAAEAIMGNVLDRGLPLEEDRRAQFLREWQ